MKNELDDYRKLIDFLGTVLDGTFEAGLFSLADPKRPALVAHSGAGEHLDKMRDFVVEAAGSQRFRDRGFFANHPIVVDVGKMLKASVLFIENAEGELAGALCLSMRCDLFFRMSDYMSKMLRFNTEGIDDPTPEAPEAPQEPSLDTITQTVMSFGVEPERFTQAERQEILVDLYDLGVFKLKGAVAKTAEALKISEQSVYRYLAKIKKARYW